MSVPRVVLSITIRLACLTPRAAGENVMLMVQLELTASDPGQLFTWLNSVTFVPARLMEVIVRVALPVFVRIIGDGLLDNPILIPPMDRIGGLKLATGACPVPVRVTLSGLLVALVTKVRLAERAPTALGVKVIPMTQLAP